MPKFLISLFTELASVIGGGVAGSLNLVVNIMQKGFGAAMQFHQEGIALARDLGLSASQAQAYTQALTESTVKLANKYGVTADAIKAVQRGISESTGRQLLLNDAQREQLVIANKLVGAQTTNQFAAEIMNHLGGQVSTVQGAISKAYATASKQGLNAQKFSATVAKNLSMANKLSFRDGVNGIIRMTALSEKLGFNLQSVESAANKFMDLDSAIESSAQLQMLGGAAGVYGSNPLTMSYEANYDPEAFTERMTKILGGKAQFDAKTGMATVNGMNRDFVKGIAQAMGISMDEAMTIAKKQAEVKFKENQFGTQLTNRFGNDEATKNYILNNSTYNAETKRLELNGRDISEYKDEEIAELKRMSSMSDHDLMVEQAQALTSLPEKIEGAASQVAASFASGIERYIPGFRDQIGIIGDFLSGHAKNWGQSVGQVLDTTLQWLETKGPEILDTTDKIFRGIDKLISSIGPIIKWVLDNPWKSLFAFIAGKAALNSLTKNPSIGAKAGKNVFGGLKNIGQKMYKGSFASNAKRAYGLLRGNNGRFKSAIGATKVGLKNMSKLAKGTVGLGTLFGVAEGATALMDYSTTKKQLKAQLDNGEITKEEYDKQLNESRMQKNENVGAAVGGTIGTALGTAFGGPVGGIIAGYVGDKLGSFVGKHWDGITTKVKNAWNTSIDFVEGASKKALESIGGKFTEWGESVSNWWGEVASPAISEKLNSIKEGAKSLASGIKDKLSDALNSETWEKIRASSKAIPILGVITEIIEFFKGPKEYIEKSKQTFKNVIETVTNFPKMISQWLYDYTKDSKWLPQLGHNYRDEEEAKEKHANGGIVGGNSYSGDRILTGLNSGEMVLNKNQQAALFNFINEMPSVLSKIGTNANVSYYNARNYSNSNVTDRSLRMSYDASNLVSRVLNSITNNSNAENNTYNSSSIMQKYKELHSNTVGGNVSNTFNGVQTDLFRYIGNIFSSIISPFSILKNSNDVKAKPVGEREYVYTPTSDNRSNGVTEVTVRDINVNVNGTLKLDAGNFTKNIDINQLLNDSSFVSQLKDLIKQSINNDINNGRFMNDIASMRGMPSQVGLWGRK